MADFLGRFHAQVSETPDAVAVSLGERRLTYRQVEAQACRLARVLRARGVQADQIVGIAANRSPETIVAVLAVLEAGAGYLPLDVAYPRDRLAFMLEDARAVLLLAEEGLETSGWAGSIEQVTIAPGSALLSTGDDSPLALPFISEHLAYAIFTSGSTGKPKGVAMTRGALAPLIEWQLTDSRMGPGSPTLQFAPLSFDVHFQEIFSTLTTGGELVLIREEHRLEARNLLELMDRSRIERLFLPFIALQSLADVAVSGGIFPRALREIITAGEQLLVTRALREFFTRTSAKLFNHYGPSETHVVTSYLLTGDPSSWADLPPIGPPLPHVTCLVIGDDGQALGADQEGELLLGGVAVARGYLYRPELTAERFIERDGLRFYKTGDLVRRDQDGVYQFLGRKDGQVKVRGYRIELGEIEVFFGGQPGVKEAAATVFEPHPGDKRVVAYLVGTDFDLGALRKRAEEALPEYMVPSQLVRMDTLPRTPSGKVDKRSLPSPSRERPALGVEYAAPRPGLETHMAAIWETLLLVDKIGIDDNFFELGGNSLLALRSVARTEEQAPKPLPITRFFEYPTIRGQVAYLTGAKPKKGRKTRASDGSSRRIAVIGMAGRFPGASGPDELWQLLRDGREGLRRFTALELETEGVSDRADPDYVPVRGVLDDADKFDARFFGVSPAEAIVVDPQQRILLELAYNALEDAGYAPTASDAVVGVYAGTHNNSYYLERVLEHPEAVARVGTFATMTGNEKDYVATRIAHRLNLKGPALSVHTACSTSLVAIATAVQHLRAGLCDMALAGGASLTFPQLAGHVYAEGGMLSKTGQTRSFDADAAGTVFSDGAALVVLKPLEDAERDGDHVYAVIHGVGINNDGGEKASFTAPSIEGQAGVIAMAQDDAGIAPDQVDYIEAHGTATPVGDPIEVEALTEAFRRSTNARGFCGLGSIKSNMGHLTAAAGVAGLIKTALALEHEFLPPSLHYESPNPKIAFEQTPFEVVRRGRAWPRADRARFAGVSAFGVGGTNAHVVLGEARVREPSGPSTPYQLLALSAKTEAALARSAARLADHLERANTVPLADVAFTLAVGRDAWPVRRSITARSAGEAVDALRRLSAELQSSPSAPGKQKGAGSPSEVVFLFPGQGAQYVGMGANLYDHDPTFRTTVDHCAELLRPILGVDLRSVLYPDRATGEGAHLTREEALEQLKRTEFTQSALFVIEYALAQRLRAWGLEPAIMLGHSVGEFVAACLAGVFDLQSALRLVARRGQLMQSMPPGAMLSVRQDASEVLQTLPADLDLAADNAPGLCVVAGSHEAVDRFAQELESRGVAARRLQTSHAFHSRMMEGARETFRAELDGVRLNPPERLIVSTLTGEVLSAEQAQDPEYWASHLRMAVRFRQAVETVARDTTKVLVEVGPGKTLTTLSSRRAPGETGPRAQALPTLTDRAEDDAEWQALLGALGRLWSLGLPLDFHAYFAEEKRHRVPLPGYSFERDSFLLPPKHSQPGRATAARATSPVPASAPPPTPGAMPSPSPSTPVGSAPPVPRNPAMNRQSHLVQELKSVFEQASGLDFSGAEADDDFISIGVDSLLVTQIALRLKQKYKVPLTIRHLMEDYSTFGKLSAFLDEKLPQDFAINGVPAQSAAPASTAPAVAAAQVVQPPAPQPVMGPAAFPLGAVNPQAFAVPQAGSGLVPQLLQMQMAQLALMQQQLSLAISAQAAGFAPAPAMAMPLAPAATPAALPSQPGAVPNAAAPAPSPKPVGTEEADAAHTKYDVKKAFGAIARIHKQSEELTAAQEARLKSFTARYNEKTKSSKAHTEEFRAVHADPRVVTGFKPRTKELTYPIVTVRSQGARLWDLDGNEYVDALNGFGSGYFGAQHPRINAALHKKLDEGMEIGPQTVLAGLSARLVCELTGLDRAAFCNTGSEAVMGALRIARTVTGRPLVVAFSGSYHGIFDEVIVRDTKTMRSVPAAPGILPEAVHNILVLEYGTPETLAIIRERAEEIAAVLVEPVQSRRPDFRPKEFIQELRKFTKEADIALIFDEVITGFRSHPKGAQHFYGIEADLCTYGKIVGGGMPIGVIAGRNPWMDALDGGTWQFGDNSTPTAGVTYFAGTFVRHPLTMAAVHESLLMMKEAGPALQDGVNALTTRFASELNAFFREAGVPIEIRHFSSLWKTFFTDTLPYGELLFCHLRDRGVHIWDGFPCFFTTAHSDQEVDFIINAYKSAIEELQAGDFLPRRPAPAALDSSKPPVPGARLGRDPQGNPAWFVPDPARAGNYVQLNHT